MWFWPVFSGIRFSLFRLSLISAKWESADVIAILYFPTLMAIN
jgi:hypothetical protein